MSKHKTKKVMGKKVMVDFDITPPVLDVVIPGPIVAGDIPALDPERVRYSFGTVSRCPRCGSTNTIATSTVGQYQYRKCRQPVCCHRYKVFGQIKQNE